MPPFYLSPATYPKSGNSIQLPALFLHVVHPPQLSTTVSPVSRQLCCPEIVGSSGDGQKEGGDEISGYSRLEEGLTRRVLKVDAVTKDIDDANYKWVRSK